MSVIRFSRLLPLAAGLILSLGIADAQAKVAVINSQAALSETAEIKKASADMEAKYKPRQDEIVKLQKDLQGIDNQLKTMAGKLTQQAEQELNYQGQRIQTDIKRRTEDLQADVDRDRSDILRAAGQRMQTVVEKLAAEKGLDVVIDVSNTVYAKPTLDITKEATAAYDKAHPPK
jgi:outer membrane protein